MYNVMRNVQFLILEAVAKLQKKVTAGFLICVCVSATNNWAPTRRILMKYDI